jgi:hypothetical protein
MAFIVPILLPFFVAFVVAGVSAFFWREGLARPMIYCVVSFLLVLGLQHFINSVVELVRNMWPLGAGNYVAVKLTPEMIEAFERQRAVQSFVIAVVTVLASYPLLSAVKNGFGR